MVSMADFETEKRVLTPDADLDAVFLLDAGEVLRWIGECVWVEREGTPLQLLHPKTVQV